MRNRKRLFSLTLAFIVPLLLLGGLLMTLNSQTATADSTEPAPPKTNPLPEAIRLGKYPAQLAGHSGAIRPDRYGPQRNDPAEGIPDHAYSPFDEVRNREYPCPPGGCEFQKGQVLVKLAAEVRLRGPNLNDAWTEDATLNETLQAQGVLRLEPIFPNARPPKPGEFVVSPQGERVPKPDLSRWHRAFLPEKADVLQAVTALAEDAGIDYAEPDYLRKPVGGPAERASSRPETDLLALPGSSTDPLYDQQWHLDATNVPQAWQWLEDNGYTPGGSRDIVVAVIDTGVDYTHPDLSANMWVNAAEFNGTPGVDDDGNGYVDDIYGADTVYPDGDPQDDHGHGTHVAGIITAQANNNEGGVGVAYNVQLMALKAAQYSGVLASSDIAEAIYYAVEKGADVLNMSFGGYARSQVEEDALAVAFGQAVLVAAAGNDSKVNLPCPFGRDMYPAAYNWVLGVMASTSGGSLASFSNFDCIPHDSHEYELLAPGVDVWSTLPNENYAAWDGTSMAAPVVSGIAALVRTRWSDKDVYSSRFIMGQIAANADTVADAYAALTVAPEPELSYLEHWLFDTEEQSLDNDDDGIVDAGETVDLAIVIRNHWGKADPVTVTLEAWAEGAVFPDPYVTMITDTVDYGAVGSFNWDDNGLIYDDEGVITGVRHPFRFTVPITTPNDHVIPFRLTMTAGNGYDPDDPNAPYVFQSRFYLIVQRGTELPTIISEDMVLTKDYYWIVPGQTLIENGATVTVTEGTQVQWGAPDPDDPYGEGSNAYIQVEGKLSAQGTYTEPVEFFPSGILGGYVSIQTSSSTGTTELGYIRVRNPKVGTGTYSQASLIDRGYFDGDRSGSISSYYLKNSIVHKFPYMEHGIQSHHVWTSLLDNLGIGIGYYGTETIVGTVFLQDNQDDRATSLTLKNGIDENAFARFFFPDIYDGKTYVTVFGSNITMDAAESIANYFSGHVVSINDDGENTYLTNYVNTYLTQSAIEAEYGNPCLDWSCPGNYQEARIGLSDVENEGDFIWISGEPVVYSNWRAGEPDDTNRWGSPGADYVVLASDSTWFDNTDQTNNFIVLELPGEVSQATLDDSLDDLVIEVASVSTVHVRNAFLSKYWDPDVNHWMRVSPYYQRGRNWYMGIANNYWGTTSTTLIEAAIIDFSDDFNKAHIVYEPFLTTPSAATFPFVVDVTLSTTSDPDATIVGAETVTFTVTFNRDMDASVQPAVSFGPDVPETDYTIHPVDGGWQDPRTWMGTFNINPITGDGYQLMRIADAVAADDPWLVTGDDVERFRFEIITSGTEAMNLQATGGEGYVDLMWTQDDFELLAGFNLYRSTSQDGTYTRINDSIIPPDQRTYRDTDVQPGQPYYYKFTVVKTDMTESDFSNVASATPVDTIPPVISHTPVTEAPPGLPLTLYADVTDNVGVQGVTLYYRAIGATDYLSRTMVNTTGDRYSATIEGSQVSSPGLEYYIEADDGVSTVRDGRAEYPHQITVEDKPVVTMVSPGHGPASGGTAVTISGSNFKDGAAVTFSGAVAEDATVVSSSQITATTPAHFPATVDVTVTNPDTQNGTLLQGFTYESEVASLSLPNTNGGQNDIVQVPVNAANVQGLAAASLTVAFDDSVLSARDASTGNLTPGWSLAANTSTPGEIRVSMASPGGTVSGSGILAYLEFEVVGSPGVSTTLQLTSVSLNDGAIPVETAAGSFQVNPVYDVGGTVRFWNGGAGVPDVLLTLDGDQVYTDQSDSSGIYTVSSAETDDYTLTPSKSDGVNGINAPDASLVLQHDTGLITLSGYAVTAGDVNKSGGINSMDAYYILQKAVELITLPFPGAGVVWDFTPSSRSYTNLSSDQTGQDFTAVLLGEVSGNWSAGGGSRRRAPAIALVPTITATLSLPQASVLPSQQVTVPLTLNLPEGELYGADIVLSYDTAVVSATAVVRGSLATDWSIASNLTTPGVVRVAMAGATPITSGGELLLLVFNAVGSAGSDTALTLTRGDLNEGGIPADLQHGNIYIARPVHADFTASPTVGIAPLTVVLTNTSTGDFDTCAWTFGDGGTSSDCNVPSYTYNSGGVNTITLTVSGMGGSDTETKVDYITVYQPPTAEFSADPTSGPASLAVSFTNLSTGDYDTCAWTFGDSGTSSDCNDPSHTYTAAGVYTATLAVSGLGGSDTETKVEYITVYQPPTAEFSGDPTSGPASLAVSFTNLSTGDFDTCAWAFGDGDTSADCNDPGHTYTAAGVYTVTLAVSGLGGSDTETKIEYITVYLLDISGEVRFWEDAAGVPGVLLNLEGDSAHSGTSDTAGAYTVASVSAGNYTLTPSKSDGVNGITAYDASFVLRHAAGLITLTSHQATAAEVTKNGGITSMDASYILQKAVDLITLPFPGTSVVWDFDPTSRSYTNLSSDQTGQDFTAILLGDVSGNWAAGVGQARIQATNTVSLTLPGLYAEPGERITITLDIALDQAEVYGADIVVNYDQTVALADSVSAGDAAQDFMTASNLNPPGQVRVAMAGAQPITDDGHLLALMFDVVGELGDTSPLQITSAELNEGGVTVQPQDGSIEVVNFPDYDFSRDCIVDVADIMKVASRWRMTDDDLDWETRYDIDGDGIITVVDIMKVVANWGATCW